jgi:DNA repair protein RecN (Recombination protein N)
MLEELSVRNYALIDRLVVPFEDALNVISGETGAGKSIIIGSLSFLLGAKAGADCIRTGADEVSVSAALSIKKENAEALAWLELHDIKTDDGVIVVRRTLKANGRNSMYLQDVPVSRAEAAEFMAFLCDIHGQHEHETLLKRETHRKYLDRFAGIDAEASEFNRVFQEFQEKRKTAADLAASEKDKSVKIELLSFSVDEIEKAALKKGETVQLEAEATRLASHEKLSAYVESASKALFDGEGALLPLSRKVKTAAEGASSLDGSLQTLAERIGALYFELEDIGAEMRSYRDGLSFNPARLEEVEERLALIHKLKKKYAGRGGAGTAEEAILVYKAEAEAEIEGLSASEERRGKLGEEIAALEEELRRRAKELTAKRKASALVLSKRISEILCHLGMQGAVFSVRVEQAAAIGPFGAEHIEFVISANKGEPLKELSRIASGGELSRVMLAIKTALSIGSGGGDNSPDTLVFDEIDTGIGGEVAITVGEYLAKIAQSKQIFCITHLASIACRADNHLLVEKKTEGERTLTTLRNLTRQERRSEIARMLSGERGETALRHADELLKKYGASGV